MKTFDAALDGMPTGAIIDAAKLYTVGGVKDQSATFPPSVAQFVAAAKDCQAALVYARRPPLPAPSKNAEQLAIETPESRARMLLKMACLKAAHHLGKVEAVARAQATGRMEEFIALAQEWGIPVSEAQWAQKDHVWVRNRR